MSEDPARDGWNWLVYCDGDPVNHQDPSGRAKLNPIGDTGWFWSWDPWYDAGKGGRKLRDITIYTPGGKRTKWSWIPSEGRWKHSDPGVLLPRKVRSTIEGGGLGISSIDSYAQQDILGFIAIMLDIAGDHEGAAELDRINGTL